MRKKAFPGKILLIVTVVWAALLLSTVKGLSGTNVSIDWSNPRLTVGSAFIVTTTELLSVHPSEVIVSVTV